MGPHLRILLVYRLTKYDDEVSPATRRNLGTCCVILGISEFATLAVPFVFLSEEIARLPKDIGTPDWNQSESVGSVEAN